MQRLQTSKTTKKLLQGRVSVANEEFLKDILVKVDPNSTTGERKSQKIRIPMALQKVAKKILVPLKSSGTMHNDETLSSGLILLNNQTLASDSSKIKLMSRKATSTEPDYGSPKSSVSSGIHRRELSLRDVTGMKELGSARTVGVNELLPKD